MLYEKPLKKSYLLNFQTKHTSNLNFLIQNKNEYNQYQTNSHYFNEYNPVVSRGVKGKEKGVFSKKQLLILFDLLGDDKLMDRIDYSKYNKFDAVVGMLQAVSGKGKDSFVEQLKHVRHEGLNSFTNEAQLTN